MPVYTNPLIDQEPNSKIVFYLDNKCAIFTCNASPEGVILANTGSIALSDNGSVYKKTTDDVNTGWVELQSGTAASPLVIVGAIPTLNFDDTDVSGQTGQITVEGGTPIVFKPSGFIVGIEKTIQTSFGAVGANAAAALTTMFSGNIPANFLPSNNDYAVIYANGGFAANDNDKRIQVTIGGVGLFNSGLIDLDTFGYAIIIRLGRIDATHLAMNILVQFGEVAVTSAAVVGSTGYLGETANTPTSVVADLSANPIAILIESQGTANNDIVLNQVIIKVCQMS